MMLPLIEIVSERRFQWGSHHRIWFRRSTGTIGSILLHPEYCYKGSSGLQFRNCDKMVFIITFIFLNQILSETISVSGNIIGFGWEIRKLAFWILSILDPIYCPGSWLYNVCVMCDSRAPDKRHKLNFNQHYLCYIFTKSYVWPWVRIISIGFGEEKDISINVTSSAKTCLMEGQLVST